MRFSLRSSAAVISAFLAIPALADITIATVGPMTGPYASIGEQMKRGAEMAAQHINESGGILGQNVVIRVEDDVCDPKQATTIANKLVADGVKYVAGHFCSSASIPASSIYAEDNTIMMTPASTAPALTERGMDTVYRLCGRDDQQGVVAAKHIVDQFPGANVAILHDKTAYGKGLSDETQLNLEKLGLQTALYEAITPGERDFNTLVTRMKARKIDVIYFGGYHTEAGLLRRQAAEQSLDATFMSGDALITTEYWSITGDTGAGTLITFSPDPRLNETAAPIVADFRGEGFEPEGYTLYNYGVVQVLAQAINAAGTEETKEVVQAINDGSFDTVRGTVSFDGKGDVTAPGYVLYEWQDGDYTYWNDDKSTVSTSP